MKESTKLFLQELSTLLEKHNAEIVASDDWTGYAECGKDIQISFDIVGDYEEIKLGNWADAKKLRLLLLPNNTIKGITNEKL